jgi:hypothetical protein
LSLGSGATFQAEIGGPFQGSQYDFLNDTGAATFGGALQLILIGGYSPTNADTFTILTDSGPLAGAFANIANGGTLLTTDGLGLFTVNYGPGSSFGSNNVVLSNFVPVPEPGSLALLAVAAVGCMCRRYRSGHMLNTCPNPQNDPLIRSIGFPNT